MGRLYGQEMVLPSLAVLLGVISLVAWLSPADKVLGDLVKLVYVHGAIIQVALFVFALAGLLGAAYLVTERAKFFEWSQALERTGILLWVLYILTSAVVMTRAWGGISWGEPRWIFGLQILVVAPIVHLGGILIQSRRVSAFLNVAMAGIIVFLLAQAQLILHPLNPVAASPNVEIKMSYNLLLTLWALTALQLARGLRSAAILRTIPIYR
ncbi:MAG: hypothetical protein A2Z04_04310 [Chloroflexi bacterium RBG_16_57_9]|nr:MAG: hypothetical protein A2Z04_04310 [Chloroflexi bacterium RBG_16_57_9]